MSAVWAAAARWRQGQCLRIHCYPIEWLVSNGVRFPGDLLRQRKLRQTAKNSHIPIKSIGALYKPLFNLHHHTKYPPQKET